MSKKIKLRFVVLFTIVVLCCGLYAGVSLLAVSYEVHARASGKASGVASMWIDNVTTIEITEHYHGALASDTIAYDQRCRNAIGKVFLYPGEHIEFNRTSRSFFVSGLNSSRVDIILDELNYYINDEFFVQ